MISLKKEGLEDIRSELKYVCVEGLNGFLKHEIYLKEEGITILHGPNGCGKTTFLEVIKNFFDSNYDEMVNYDFDKITFKFNSYSEGIKIKEDLIIVQQKIINLGKIFDVMPASLLEAIEESDSKLVALNISWNGEKLKDKIIFNYDENVNEDLNIRIRNRPMRNSEEGREVIEVAFESDSESFRKLFDINYFIYDNNDEDFELESEYVQNRPSEDVEKDLNLFLNNQKFFMINTQRLINILRLNENNRRRDKFGRVVRDKEQLDSHLMIENHAKNISSKITKSFADSAEKTQKTDKSFPQRLIQIFKDSYVEDIESIREKYSATENKINRILKAGLLLREKNIALPKENFDDVNIKKVLQLYLQDLNEKLIPYEDILEKIETFQEIIGSKIKNKEMKINHEDGFYFISKINNKKLKLKNLSSGEQHQIVLFFELIFLANSGTYYLIDEPEISLHVDWQRSFLNDIARVEKLRGHKFIIATHSPQIIGSRRSLCVALDGGILDNE